MNGYFDFNATTPLAPAARKAWLNASDRAWHNPSSLYQGAGNADRILEEQRETLARMLGCPAEQIIFTSGATEANNAIIHWAIRKGLTFRHSAIEHPCVRVPALRQNKVEIPVHPHGVIDLDSTENLMRASEIALISVMAANNETGVIQPMGQLHELCQKHQCMLHSDAAQWFGKLPMASLKHIDWLTGSAHKFGGPKGTGFLKIPADPNEFEIYSGGPQERSLRAGTEDVPGICAMVAALQEAEAQINKVTSDRRDAFEANMQGSFPGIRIVGKGAERLWNTSMLIMPEHENIQWLIRLNQLGFSISTGSACSSGKEGPSHVLQAMGYPYEDQRRVLRISSGMATGESDYKALHNAFLDVSKQLKRKRNTGRKISLSDLGSEGFPS